MTPPTANLPLRAMTAGFRRFSLAEYHKLIEIGLLTEDDDLELLDGYLVNKMPHNPPHDGTIQRLAKKLGHVLPAGWDLRIQSAVTFSESEPEPDLAVVRGDENTYLTRHPGPADIGLIIEVANTTLVTDRMDKGRIYARAQIGTYWIVNLVDGLIEVCTGPSGPAAAPGYARRTDYRAGDLVPLELDGTTVAGLPAQELLP